ncbi:MAG: (2E,6E)-farnesyl diphosphate synthase [Gammaproteobacteria bacterium]|nr:MAG: (2E,6E)-farnesyl diphosphate synthase [Gammaproteobacteria bacterium]
MQLPACAFDADFDQLLETYRRRVDTTMPAFLPPVTGARTSLPEAMHYALTNGGKRVRPILAYATGSALGICIDRIDRIACALEMVHAYSLVHDDLPAMDDDDLRRGKPTVHRAFDEATAILAGDALQALAFTVLTDNDDSATSNDARIAMLKLLGEASGASGMALGQAIDLEAVGRELDIDELENMHRHKTGALIKASVLMPACMLGALPEDLHERLAGYADAVGLAFQIVDDILDVVGDTETLGKTRGADEARGKPTYPALLGLDGARAHAEATHQRAIEQLAGLGDDFEPLRQLSSYVVERSH